MVFGPGWGAIVQSRWADGSVVLMLLQRLALIGGPVEHWWRSSLWARFSAGVGGLAKTSFTRFWVEPAALGALCLALAVSPFVSTEVTGAVLVLALALGIVLFTVGSRPPLAAALPVLAYWLAGLVALAASPRFVLSLDGFLKLTLYVGVFAVAAHLCQRAAHRTTILATYLVTTLPVSLYGLYQWRVGAAPLATWVDPESSLAEATRVYSFLGNPNLLAGYLLAAVPLGAVGALVWRSWGARATAALAALSAAVCIVFTFSRGAWIALGVGGLLFALLLLGWLGERFDARVRPWLPVALLGGLACALVLVAGLVPAVGERAASIFTGRGDSSNNFRLNVWAAVIDMIRAFPFTGIGPGNRTFEAIYPFFQRPKYNALSAYSIFLEIAVEMGILGILAFAWLSLTVLVQGLVTWFARVRTDERTLWAAAAVASVVALLVDGATDTVWFRPAVQIVWWVLCAVIATEFARGLASNGQDM